MDYRVYWLSMTEKDQEDKKGVLNQCKLSVKVISKPVHGTYNHSEQVQISHLSSILHSGAS